MRLYYILDLTSEFGTSLTINILQNSRDVFLNFILVLNKKVTKDENTIL